MSHRFINRSAGFAPIVSLAALVALSSGCSGGSAPAGPPANAIPGTTPKPVIANSVRGSLTVVVPARGTAPNASRKPAYVSPNTKRIDLAVTDASGAYAGGGSYPLTNVNCVAQPTGAQICTLPFNVAPGNDTFTVTSYDDTTNNGNVIGYAKTTQTIGSGAANALSITLLGEPAPVAFAFSTNTFTYGKPGTVTVPYSVSDADGLAIVGTFDAPIALALTGDVNHYALSAPMITSNGATVTVTYDGDPVAGAVFVNSKFISPARFVGLSGAYVLTSQSEDLSGFTRLLKVGDAFDYTTVKVTTRSTQANPVPTTTTSTSTSHVTIDSMNATFNNVNGLIDQTTVTTPAASGTTVPTPTTMHSYLGFKDGVDQNAAPIRQILGYGTTSSTTSTTSTNTNKTVFTPLPNLQQILPETPGTSFDNLTAQHQDTLFTSGSNTSTFTFDFDVLGGSSGHNTFTLGQQTIDDVYAENDNGTSREVFTQSGFTPQTLTYGLPILANGSYTIPVQSVGGDATGAPASAPTTTNVADWYPGNALPPQPLSRFKVRIIAPVAIPVACGTTAGLPASDQHQDTTQFSSLGLYVTSSSDVYQTQDMGRVCFISLSRIISYDAIKTGAVFSDTTVSATFVLTNETLASIRRNPALRQRRGAFDRQFGSVLQAEVQAEIGNLNRVRSARTIRL